MRSGDEMTIIVPPGSRVCDGSVSWWVSTAASNLAGPKERRGFTVQCSRQWLSSTISTTFVASLVRIATSYRVTAKTKQTAYSEIMVRLVIASCGFPVTAVKPPVNFGLTP